MWDACHTVAKTKLPNAQPVVDHFHVTKNLNAAVTTARRTIQKQADEATQAILKGCRWLLVKNREKLTDEERAQLAKMLEVSPELKTCYDLKEDFRTWFAKTTDRETADKTLSEWQDKAKATKLHSLQAFVKTLDNWREGILNYFNGRHSNGFAEGVNLKIKMLNRRGFGYRNFAHFRSHIWWPLSQLPAKGRRTKIYKGDIMRPVYTLRVFLSIILLLESLSPLHTVFARQPSIDKLEQTADSVYLEDIRKSATYFPLADEKTPQANALIEVSGLPLTTSSLLSRGLQESESAFPEMLNAPLALPAPPSNPNPADGAVNVSIFLDQLTWTCAPDATSYAYRIWLGTDPKPSQSFDTSDCLGYIPLLHPESGELRGNATYKWEVTSSNASGSTPGPEWSFTTEALPNIVVSKPSTPTSAADGATISFTYTITNTGPLVSSPPGWVEVLYLSSDPVLNTGTDMQVGAFNNPSILTPGQAVTLVREVQLPPNTTGAYYTFVNLITLFIDGNYGDNISPAGDPINIGVTPRPDLKVSIPQMAATAANDDVISATITITNQGTQAAAGWMDRLYLSPTSTYNPYTALLVGELAHPGTLAAGQSEMRSLNIHIPADISGSYFAFARTDALDALVELDENNNFSPSGFAVQVNALPPSLPSQPNPVDGSLIVPVDIALGWQATPRTQTYEVRLWPQGQVRPIWANASVNVSNYDPPGNLNANTVYNWEVTAVGVGGSASGPTWTFTTQPLPDLVVSAVNPPAQAFSGQQIQVDWVVSNQGSRATTGNWNDAVYLSSSPIFDQGTAVWLGASPNHAALAPGESYQRSAIFTLPQGVSGPYYFHVRTDLNNTLLEDQESNNVNHSATTNIILTPPPDLQVSALRGPAVAFSGSSIQGQWQVTNQGTGDTGVGWWIDRLYLSKDAVFDLTTDIVINNSYHAGVLAPGASYTQTISA